MKSWEALKLITEGGKVRLKAWPQGIYASKENGRQISRSDQCLGDKLPNFFGYDWDTWEEYIEQRTITLPLKPEILEGPLCIKACATCRDSHFQFYHEYTKLKNFIEDLYK